jgi:hypothetical protein
MNVLAIKFVGRKWKGTRNPNGSDNLESFATAVHQISPFLKRSLIWSAVRAASAMMVKVGFFSEEEGNTLPSTT